MSDTTGSDGQGTPENGGTNDDAPQTFTQEQVNELVGKARTDERRKAQAKFADYDDLRTKAEGAKTLEDRIADMESRAMQAEARALRSDIAARFGISAEDRDLFLTGTDEETLTTQAARLADRVTDRKKQGNVAPKEGGNPEGKPNTDERAFVRELFGKAAD